MYFKWSLTLLVLTSVMLTSCSWFRDNPANKDKSAIIVDLEGGSCLKNWSGRMKRYFEGGATLRQVNEFWGCLDAVVTEFQRQTTTRETKGYRIEKLRILIQKVFLGKKQIPDSLVKQLVELKQAIFGGDSEYLSFQEIERLHMIISKFWDSSLRLLPHASVLSLHDIGANEARVMAATNELNVQAKIWSQTLGEIHQSYEIANLLELWNEINNYFALPVNENKKADLAKKLNLAKAVKSLVINPPGNWILKQDWPRLYTKLGKVWGAYVNYHYLVEDKDYKNILKMPKLNHLQSMVQFLLEELRDGVDFHKSKNLSQEELNELVLSLKALNWVIPEGVKPAAINYSIEKLTKTIFRENLQFPLENGQGLGRKALERLSAEIGSWFLHQKFVSSVFESNKDFESRENIVTLSRGWKTNSIWQESFSNGLAQYKLGPTLPDNPMLRHISSDPALNNRHDFMSLTHLNWSNTMLRIITQGYALSPERRERASALTEIEFQRFYEDIYPLGVDLGFLDPLVKTAGRRTFREANFFTASGNGDPWMSITEGTEEISLLMSGGSLAKTLHDDMRLLCRDCQDTPLDVFGLARVDRRHLFTVVDKNFKRYFRGLPDLSAFYSGLDVQEKYQFLNQYLDASMGSPEERSMGTPELRVFSVLLHFTESIMRRFDLDRSGFLDVLEVESAFPTFQMLFSEVWLNQTGSEGSDEDLMAVFVYLLHNGEVLTAGDGWINKVKAWLTLREYKTQRYRMGIQVNRLGLSKVFSVMKKHLSR